jgi:PAN domain
MLILGVIIIIILIIWVIGARSSGYSTSPKAPTFTVESLPVADAETHGIQEIRVKLFPPKPTSTVSNYEIGRGDVDNMLFTVDIASKADADKNGYQEVVIRLAVSPTTVPTTVPKPVIPIATAAPRHRKNKDGPCKQATAPTTGPAQYKKYPGGDLPFRDISNHPNSSVEDCTSKCDGDSNCQGFMLLNNDQCWLKNCNDPTRVTSGHADRDFYAKT